MSGRRCWVSCSLPCLPTQATLVLLILPQFLLRLALRQNLVRCADCLPLLVELILALRCLRITAVRKPADRWGRLASVTSEADAEARARAADAADKAQQEAVTPFFRLHLAPAASVDSSAAAVPAEPAPPGLSIHPAPAADDGSVRITLSGGSEIKADDTKAAAAPAAAAASSPAIAAWAADDRRAVRRRWVQHLQSIDRRAELAPAAPAASGPGGDGAVAPMALVPLNLERDAEQLLESVWRLPPLASELEAKAAAGEPSWLVKLAEAKGKDVVAASGEGKRSGHSGSGSGSSGAGFEARHDWEPAILRCEGLDAAPVEVCVRLVAMQAALAYGRQWMAMLEPERGMW